MQKRGRGNCLYFQGRGTHCYQVCLLTSVMDPLVRAATKARHRGRETEGSECRTNRCATGVRRVTSRSSTHRRGASSVFSTAHTSGGGSMIRLKGGGSTTAFKMGLRRVFPMGPGTIGSRGGGQVDPWEKYFFACSLWS